MSTVSARLALLLLTLVLSGVVAAPLARGAQPAATLAGPTKINFPLGPNMQVSQAEIGKRHMLFEIVENLNDPQRATFSLYVAQLDGSNPVKVYDGYGRYGIYPQFTSDERHLLITRYGRAGTPGRLYRVPVTGGEPVLLSGDQIDVATAYPTPDGQSVVISGNEPGQIRPSFHIVPLAGGQPRLLIRSYASMSIAVAISADSKYLVFPYPGYEDNFVLTLYAVPLAGGEPVKLNGGIQPSDNFDFFLFKVSPDGRRVLFATGGTLYSVPITGGQPVALGLLDSRDSSAFAFTPDSTAAVARHTGGQPGLYRVPLAGGAAIPLNDPAASTQPVESFALTPDGQYVIYKTLTSLFRVPAEGGPALNLTPNGLDGGRPVNFQVSPDNTDILVMSARGDQRAAYWNIPVVGGAPVRLTPPLPEGGHVHHALMIPGRDEIIYMAEQEHVGVVEAYLVSLRGGPIQKVSGPMTSGGNVESMVVSEAEDWVFYTADQDTNSIREFYAYPLGRTLKPALYLPLVSYE